MRLLVVNYEMDDGSPVLAWQAGVVRELARRADRVAVLTERAGDCALPGNVAMETVPRPGRARAIGRRAAALGATWRLARRERVDAVFVHMAHRQAYRLWPVFRLLRLPVLLWYAHGAVTWHLRLAHRSVDRVISSSPEGFRLRSARAHFIGQGVDTELFSLRPPAAARPHLLAVGRISRRKRLDLLVSMMAHLRGDGLTLRIVGPALTGDDAAYEAALRRDVAAGRLPVEFLGPVPIDRLPALYDTAALALNVSETNSMDKAVLEALATGCPVLSSNPAFRELLAGHPRLVIKDERPEAIAAQLRALLADPGAAAPEDLRSLVEGHHDIVSYADRVMAHLTAVMRR